MIYLQSQIKLHPGKIGDFTGVMNKLAAVLTSKHGWKLVGSFATMVGRLDTVLDLWELPDLGAYQAALSDPEVIRFGPRIQEIVADEILSFVTRLPIG
ncbi:MAG TPA: NIPSNAP family protein [Kofleriaceae bacterium]|nr:NIPSNAP family protein [Kofleriaceae bacterium]